MPDPLTEGRVAFIGCGKMGEAMLAGWQASEDACACDLMQRGVDVVVPDEGRAAVLETLYGVRTFTSADEAPEGVSVVILTVKPQMMDEVLPKLAASAAFAQGSPLVISIAAGVPCARFEDALPEGTHVVRVMPNMPLQVQAGASVVAKGAHATDADAAFVNQLFCALGVSVVVDESQMDAVCALSGGGPAYFAYLAECMAAAGVQAGLDPVLAESLARQTLAGTGAFLAEGQSTLAELRQSVCSPGGTTLAALDAMQQHGLSAAVTAGVQAAITRAKELSTC